MAWRRCLGWLLLAVGCGGQVTGGGAGTRGAAGATGDGVPSRVLGPCHPGTPYAPGQACPWIAGGLCYATVDAACDCVCPRDHAPLCISGLPDGPEGQVSVTCS